MTHRVNFRKDLVVMVCDGVDSYPIKLVKPISIGNQWKAWFDTLGNVEHEHRMRPLTAREAGKRNG